MKEPIKQYKSAEKLELPKIKKDFPKVFKKVICPSCGGDVHADNLNLQNTIAKCGSCHVIFSIEKEVASLKEKKEVKQKFFRPEGINLFYFKNDLEISVDGYVNQWDVAGLMLFLSGAGIGSLLYFEKNISILVPIIFALFSIFFIYRMMNYKKNRIYIDVNEDFLTVKHRPNNLIKDKTFAAEDVDQVYLKQSNTQGGYFDIYLIVNGPKGQYHQKLFVINSLAKAKYLEQEIEKYLGIEDRKVPEATA